MNVIISDKALASEGLTLRDFGILLYYIDGGTDDICPEIGNKLWNKNLLTKIIGGYEYNQHQDSKVQEWLLPTKEKPEEQLKRFIVLADKLRELFPKGSKDGTWSWRDNTMTIAKKLYSLHEKFCSFTDEDAIEATKKYVEYHRNKNNFAYMQLLKYFILKHDRDKGEETSGLITLIQNKEDDMEAPPTGFYDNGNIV